MELKTKTPSTSHLYHFQSSKQKQNSYIKDKNNKVLNRFSPKDKINYLHKMLDHQIQTVSTLFDKDNAFEQIQIKLKQLQVKLDTIKEDNHKAQFNSISKNSKTSLSNIQAYFKQSYKENSASPMPFQSLGQYKMKKTKKNQNTQQKNSKITKNKQTNQIEESQDDSNRKLNFDDSQMNKNQNQVVNLSHINKKMPNQFSNRKSTKKNAKEENMLRWLSTKRRSKSSKLEDNDCKSLKKNLSMQKSSKKSRRSSKNLNKQLNCSHKSTAQKSVKKISHSNTAKHLNKQSWKNIPAIYGNQMIKIKKNQSEINDHKGKVRQIILQNQNKKLQRELSTYKLRNSNLREKVKELKNYKHEYDKLKNIFERKENLHKNRIKY